MHKHKAEHQDYNDHTKMNEENINEIEHDHHYNHNEHGADDKNERHHGNCCSGAETFRKKSTCNAHDSYGGHHGGCCGGFSGCGIRMWILIGIVAGLLLYLTN